jgi:hypothetical protein
MHMNIHMGMKSWVLNSKKFLKLNMHIYIDVKFSHDFFLQKITHKRVTLSRSQYRWILNNRVIFSKNFQSDPHPCMGHVYGFIHA